MKVVDIIKQSATLLDLTEAEKALNNITEENEGLALSNEDVYCLFNLVKYSIQELCTNYVPVAAIETVKTYNKAIEINKLTNFIRVQNIYKDEELVKYKIINRCIYFEEDGEYSVQYATYPQIESLLEEIDFLSNFSPDIVVLGLSAYYALSKGRFDEFEIYHNQYVEKAESIKGLKMFNMPQRRWEWEQKKELQ